MSKRNREKRSTSSEFPFLLLQFWARANAHNQKCAVCGKLAWVSIHNFTDVEKHQRLVAEGKIHSQSVDILWNEAILEQMKDIHTIKNTFYACKNCFLQIMSDFVGENSANLAFLSMNVSDGISSVAVGSHVSSWEDDGSTFACIAHAQTLDELIRQFRTNFIHIKLTE